MYKINPSLCCACFLLCSAQAFNSVSWSGSKKGHNRSFAPVYLMTRHLMKLVFQPLLHIARTQSCEKVFKAALGNKNNKLWRKVFPLWNEFKAQRHLGAGLTIKLGNTRRKWQLACGEEPSLLWSFGIKPLTGTAKANWTWFQQRLFLST